MKVNKDFLTTLREMIQQSLSDQEVLLESPVRSQQQLVVENKINRILSFMRNENGKKD